MNDETLVSLMAWAYKEGLSLSREQAAGFMNLAMLRPADAGTEKDHRGVTLPSRHRAGGIITPQ